MKPYIRIERLQDHQTDGISGYKLSIFNPPVTKPIASVVLTENQLFEMDESMSQVFNEEVEHSDTDCEVL